MTKEQMIRDFDYKDSVNYKEVLDTFNALIAEGKQADAKRLMGEHGGKIAVLMKYNYQVGNF